MELAWEAISGTCMCPYPSGSVRMDLGTTPRKVDNSGESFGNVDFQTEIDGFRRTYMFGFSEKVYGS